MSWISASTAGSTKKSAVLAAYNAASSVGNIVGPLLFYDTDAPLYHSCIGIFGGLAASILQQLVNFVILNRGYSVFTCFKITIPSSRRSDICF
ncbi:hypothetical protein C8R44DRAFT_794817 [Mycena epipterygia]|nr:hypothetical protein C8R44DRAFT_794817 [Mycena epipterygia]